MAASVKFKWSLSRYAKFVFHTEEEKLDDNDEQVGETLDIPCKGKWKVYTGKENEILLSYLESDHLLITHKDIILESFSLLNSCNWLKGVAKGDSLLILNKLKDGNNRRFRIQFGSDDGNNGHVYRTQCTNLLRKYFSICDQDAKLLNASNCGEIAKIDKNLLDKQLHCKAYALSVPKEHVKEILMLCLTDSTFPSYVTEVDNMIKNIGK